MNQTTILKVLIGSKAHGTDTEDSDTDHRIVFVNRTSDVLSVGDRGHSNQIVWEEAKKTGGEGDLTGWELAHFCKLALNCNPTILEVLWAPTVYENDHGKALRWVRRSFLSRQRIFDAFRGYASNQAKKMLWEPGSGVWSVRNWKFAEAYLRVLYQGRILLAEKELPVALKAEGHHDLVNILTDVKAGRASIGEVMNLAQHYEEDLRAAWIRSDIWDKPDLDEINRMVLKIRKDYW